MPGTPGPGDLRSLPGSSQLRRVRCRPDISPAERIPCRQLDNLLRHLSWNHGKDIEVRRLSPQSLVLADDEATDTMEIHRRVQPGVQLREERQPRLGGTVKRHCQHPRFAAWSICSSTPPKEPDSPASIRALPRALRPNKASLLGGGARAPIREPRPRVIEKIFESFQEIQTVGDDLRRVD